MYLENIVFDAVDPRRLGTFWEAVLGGNRLTDEHQVYETRLTIEDGPVIDLCFQRVRQRSGAPVRLHFDLLGGQRQTETVDRLLGLGAEHLDVGQGDVPWVVLADPEGSPFCVMEHRAAYVDTGPIAALPLASADPARDRDFWVWLTGWTPVSGAAPESLRHKSMRGPLLEFCPESARKARAKNEIHLDIRLEAGDDPGHIAASIAQRGGRELQTDGDELPWRVYADPSGNEFCVLPAKGR